MTSYDFDLLTIGAGSGGVRATRMAATYGAKAGVVEEYRVGGTCVIRGCVPKKILVYASRYSEDFNDAAGFGGMCRTAIRLDDADREQGPRDRAPGGAL